MFDHGGDIQIEHAPNGITSYTVVLPFRFKKPEEKKENNSINSLIP
jgi:hypothetical protein